jgi:Rieske Fe-S protein
VLCAEYLGMLRNRVVNFPPMTRADQSPSASSGLDRRQFIQLLLTGTVGFFGRDLLFPQVALADNAASSKLSVEQYHIFVGSQVAQKGGKQAVTFKSGKTELLKIAAGSSEDAKLVVKRAALNGGDATVTLHTLYDPSIDFDTAIETALAAAPLMVGTRDRCRDAYHQIKVGEYVEDVHAQDILDIVISGSPEIEKNSNGKQIRERYQLASQSSRLIALENEIEETLASSGLSNDKKLHLKGIYQYVRANEPLPSPEDFDDLTAVDAIVQNSKLPLALKQRYAVASAQTRAFTVDKVIMALIQ